MKSRPNTGFGFLLMGIILFLGCRSMYLGPNAGGTGGSGGTGGTDFAQTGAAGSFFRAMQIDPRSEDSAGPAFAAVGDFDGDSLMDVASAWNQSQPVQIHLQRRTATGGIAFETVPIAGTAPIAIVADLHVEDMDGDGNLDVVVLVKDTGLLATCDASCEACDPTDNGGVIDEAYLGGIIILYAPDDTARDVWTPALLSNSFLAGTSTDCESLARCSYTDMDIGDIDGDDLPDIVVAFNSAEECLLEPDPFVNDKSRIDLYANPGGLGDLQHTARNGDAWLRVTISPAAISSDFIEIPPDRPVRRGEVTGCKILDVDRDGDNDVVSTYVPPPNPPSANVRWLVNPLDTGEAFRVLSNWGPFAPIGQVDTGVERVEIGDIDGDGLEDVLVASPDGRIVQWFKRPASPSYNFIRSPWQVYTLAEFLDRSPQAIAIGDLTGDGQVEVAISAEGAVAWFGAPRAQGVFDQWTETLIIDDAAPQSDAGTDALADLPSLSDAINQLMTDPQQEGPTATLVNSVVIADIDGDGTSDIVGTLDRVDDSGLANDALFLFRNQRR